MNLSVVYTLIISSSCFLAHRYCLVLYIYQLR